MATFQAGNYSFKVRCYLGYPLSYRNLESMMAERELSIDHSTIYRWVIAVSYKNR